MTLGWYVQSLMVKIWNMTLAYMLMSRKKSLWNSFGISWYMHTFYGWNQKKQWHWGWCAYCGCWNLNYSDTRGDKYCDGWNLKNKDTGGVYACCDGWNLKYSDTRGDDYCDGWKARTLGEICTFDGWNLKNNDTGRDMHIVMVESENCFHRWRGRK